MNWTSAFRSRNPNRQSLFDSDLQGLLTAPSAPQPRALPSAIPTAAPKPLLLPPQGGPGGAFGPLQAGPIMGQGQALFGQPGPQVPPQAAPQAQNSLSNWLTRMTQRSNGQQQAPGWRAGPNALTQGWRSR